MPKVGIMPCLDLKDGRVVKGVNFTELKDAGDPVECAKTYYLHGADELALLDIGATDEKRGTTLGVVRSIAEVIQIPLTVGGGVNSVESAGAVLSAGADRVSVGTAGFMNPKLFKELALSFGRDSVVAAVDVDRNPQLPSGYEIYIHGGKTPTGRDALIWMEEVQQEGAGSLLVTSKACDGTGTGYDLELLRLIKSRVELPVIASGGAGTFAHFLAAAQAGADVLLAASVFHFGQIGIGELKEFLAEHGFC
ncbi:MAG: imidazole glycerol phosphate synthase cyclase subunit [Limnochordia bacterium]|nr:imidazole glycerol phosphate synthase cyclase subunit [Limnochordia bacterium]MDD2630476.1 imidazole glycerol phosphate synthase cyclase subunit [Limnochordia bacterium]